MSEYIPYAERQRMLEEEERPGTPKTSEMVNGFIDSLFDDEPKPKPAGKGDKGAKSGKTSKLNLKKNNLINNKNKGNNKIKKEKDSQSVESRKTIPSMKYYNPKKNTMNTSESNNRIKKKNNVIRINTNIKKLNKSNDNIIKEKNDEKKARLEIEKERSAIEMELKKIKEKIASLKKQENNLNIRLGELKIKENNLNLKSHENKKHKTNNYPLKTPVGELKNYGTEPNLLFAEHSKGKILTERISNSKTKKIYGASYQQLPPRKTTKKKDKSPKKLNNSANIRFSHHETTEKKFSVHKAKK